jgi:hypothetical protein
MHKPRILVLTGALLLLLGSRLPWMSATVLFGVDDPVSRSLEIGWEDNGFITAALGQLLFLGCIFLKGRVGKPYSIPGAVFAMIALFVVTGCFIRILEIAPSVGFFAATDIGIYVTLLGALLALVGALWVVRTPPGPGICCPFWIHLIRQIRFFHPPASQP